MLRLFKKLFSKNKLSLEDLLIKANEYNLQLILRKKFGRHTIYLKLTANDIKTIRKDHPDQLDELFYYNIDGDCLFVEKI